jgi:hypothetical protein
LLEGFEGHEPDELHIGQGASYCPKGKHGGQTEGGGIA